MKYFLQSVKPLALDFLSTIAFVLVLLVLHDVQTAIIVGIVVGVVGIGWQFARTRKLGVMQAASLFLVVALGGASLLTHDPRFVMIKPSIGYAAIGLVMLKPGWQARYVPPVALDLVPESRFVFWGFAWAALMLGSAVGNLALVALVDVTTWARIVPVWGIASKLVLFLIQFASIRLEAGRNYRARKAAAEASAT